MKLFISHCLCYRLYNFKNADEGQMRFNFFMGQAVS